MAVKELRVESAEATFRGIQLDIGLIIDELRLSLPTTLVRTEPFDLIAQEVGQATVRMSEESLTSFMVSQAPPQVTRMDAKLANDRLTIELAIRILVEIKGTAVCTFRIHEGRQLFVDLEDVNVMGAGPRTLIQQQLDKVNPVFDAEDLPVRVRLTRVECRDGNVFVYGDVTPALPA